MLRKVNSRKGYALVVVLLVFFVITIIGTTALTIARSEMIQTVSVEKYNAAFYLARSAVDVVSEDIATKLASLKVLEDAIISAGSDPVSVDAAIAAYSAAKLNFNNLLLVPAVGSTSTTLVTGITTPVQTFSVHVKNIANTIEVDCTTSSAGSSATAKARVGTLNSTTFNVSRALNNGANAIYGWGDVTLKNGKSNISVGSIATCGETFIPGNSGLPILPVDKRNVPIILPEPDKIENLMKNAPNKLSPGKSEVVALTKNDNGNYGNLSVDYANWNVNTDLGDVILVFTSLYIKNKSTVNVSGAHNLYIYLVEPYTAPNIVSRTLVDAKSGFDVKGLDASGNPLTYIISYNDIMQKWYASHTILIPFDDVSLQKPHTLYDSVTIKNNFTMDAFMYMPYCNVTIENKMTMVGSIYGGTVDAKNSPDITYKPFGDARFAPVTQVLTTTTIPVNAYTFSSTKIWLR